MKQRGLKSPGLNGTESLGYNHKSKYIEMRKMRTLFLVLKFGKQQVLRGSSQCCWKR